MDFSTTTFNNKFLREILPVYDAPNLSSKKLEISELSELSKSVDSLANSHDIKVNNGKSDFKNTIYFKDAISDRYIKIGLSDENLNTLKRVFGNDDVFKNDDGSVILNGNAQNFVSSWFADIAYKRGYLRADDDKNGVLNKAEQERTNSYFAEFGKIDNVGTKITQVSIEGVDKYYKKSDYISSLITEPSGFSFTSDTIESELNRTLSADKNQDRLITQNELMSKQQQDTYLKNIVSATADTRQIRLSKLATSNEDEIKMLEALQAKIKLENVGKEGLSSDEKEALAKFYPDALKQSANTNNEEMSNMQNLLSELKDSFLESIRVDKFV